MTVEAFRSLINPDDATFANPSSMVSAIQDYCRRTSQPVPETPAEICRCIFDSLALRYKQVFNWLMEFRGLQGNLSPLTIPEQSSPTRSLSHPSPLNDVVLHIIGGGSLNKYLNQFTANATGVVVKAGPQEGTALGNIMMQAQSAGLVNDIWQMRQIIANSIDLVTYTPQDKALWDAAYEKYLKITQ